MRAVYVASGTRRGTANAHTDSHGNGRHQTYKQPFAVADATTLDTWTKGDDAASVLVVALFLEDADSVAVRKGTLPAADVAQQLRGLSETDKPRMARLGLRFGVETVYLPDLLKPRRSNCALSCGISIMRRMVSSTRRRLPVV